ncbi:MAG: prolipoprotein diacylglyceryl transferase [Rickettsiales bacterium]|jgi:phosphatidylglycerol---prolipoprotein diacylglyceryl transferase|nr:prolipoprotein diacylglyceryl transferase [Rickettsiales bacterium]
MFVADFDPNFISLGPISIKWYSLAYIFGIIVGFCYLAFLEKKYTLKLFSKKQLDDLMFKIVLGIILGGRFGYVLFYNLPYYLSNPIEALYVWQGGMSFHGGLIGLTIAVYLHSQKEKNGFLRNMDFLACATPPGLFFGRIANFINGELYGKITTSDFGIIFPRGGMEPRHPSQLYEATLEGIVTFCILCYLVRIKSIREQSGRLAASFMICYGISRIIIEFFRIPDQHIGYLVSFVTMGQLLSLPMILLGIYMILHKKNYFTRL